MTVDDEGKTVASSEEVYTSHADVAFISYDTIRCDRRV